MKRLSGVVFLMLLIFGAVNAAELTIEEIKFCIAIESRQPVGEDTAFSNKSERIWCYTKITGADEPTQVTHVWYHENEEKARITLNVKGAPWRTWSSKKMVPAWHGNWRVDVLDAAGNAVNSATFTLAKDTE